MTYAKLSSYPGLLIAGAAGAGKTALLQLILDNLPSEAMALVYGKPFCANQYTVSATLPSGGLSLLRTAVEFLDARKEAGPGIFLPLYVCVDDYDALVLAAPRVKTLVLRLLREGPSAQMYTVLTTQLTISKVLPKELLALVPARVALRTETVADSKAILGAPGAEELPEHGYCAFVQNGQIDPICVELPTVKPHE